MKKRRGSGRVALNCDLSASQRSEGKYLKLKSRLALFLFSLLSPFALCGKLQTVCAARRAHLPRRVFVCPAPLMKHVIIIIIALAVVRLYPRISSHCSPPHQHHRTSPVCRQKFGVSSLCFIVCFPRAGPRQTP